MNSADPNTPHISAQLTEIAKAHPVAAFSILALCTIVAAGLKFHIWHARRRKGFAWKLFWSCIVIVPLFGWAAYGLFNPPPTHDEGTSTPFGKIYP